jgi:hypothetical protein
MVAGANANLPPTVDFRRQRRAKFLGDALRFSLGERFAGAEYATTTTFWIFLSP